MIKKFLVFTILVGAVAVIFYFSHYYNQRLANVSNAKPAEIQLTVIEGWTTKDIGSYLKKIGYSQEDYFLSTQKSFDVKNYPLLNSKPGEADLEGFLFPDTYRVFDPKGATTPNSVTKNADPNAVLIGKMLNNFSLKFTAEMQAQAVKQKMSVYQIVTLASIIEKETGRNAVTDQQKQDLDAERKIISGIFYNRLNAGMPLQSDATVNFITNKNLPSVSDADTQIDSLYNTYKYKGLPPGPICNPSLSSLLAALYPTKNDYFYFLHKQPSGEPVYSKTFEEHLQNKAKYLH